MLKTACNITNAMYKGLAGGRGVGKMKGEGG